MKTFSVARAFSAGVDVVERKPMVLVWWTLAVLLLAFAPRLIVSHMAGANELGAMRDLLASLNDHEKLAIASGRLQASQHALGIWALPLGLWGLFVNAILYNAAFRAVLQPQKSSFGYLRLGAAEFWQFAVQIVVGILVTVYTVVCVFLFIMVVAASKLAGAGAGWVVGLTLVLLAIFTFWLSLRLSLGAVATFAERRFAYFDSWKLTKGVSWRLFWTGFLICALLIGLYIMVLAGTLFSLLPLAGLLPTPAGAPPPTTAPMAHGLGVAGLMSVASVATLVWLILGSLVAAVMQAFALPPWAEIYRSITGGEDTHA
ncbi:MAG TPA: hypothetical protein VG407_12380 [Caulobacteraceae bacterium]|jgi:hypothetical protein|nr:hypothetical protein [Caulobacteraceae bacterium]